MILPGCATVGGNKQIVSIDSEPRGATMTLDGEKGPSGTSPFYLKMQRVPSERLHFRLGAEEKVVEIDCSFRWRLELIGNGIFGLLAPEAAIVGILVDLATGAAFECPNTVLATFDGGGPRRDARYCRRYVLAPPAHLDSSRAERLATMWQREARRALTGCDDFVGEAAAQDVFDVLGISHREPVSLARLDAEKLHFLGNDAGATHLVVPSYTISGDLIRFNPEVYDLHRGSSVEVPRFAMELPGGRGYQLAGGEWLALWTFSGIPNSMTYGYSKSTFGFQGVKPWRVEAQKDEEDTLPAALSSASLTSVEHPQAFAAWDFALSTYPEVELFSASARLTLEDDDGNRRMRDVSSLFVLPSYHAAATAHTALGAFTVSVGSGLSLGRFKAEGQPARLGAGSVGSAEVVYTAFLTQTLFFQAAASSFLFVEEPWSARNEVTVNRNFGSVVARAGYYFPRLKRRLRAFGAGLID